MHVSNVDSNVKSGASTALAPVTLIVGPPFSGKSSIIQAVRLGLAGKLEGELAANADLLLLHPQGEGTLYAKLALTEEGAPVQTNHWTVTGSTSKASRPQWAEGLPRGAVVSDVVRTLLGSTGPKLRASLLQACAPKDAVKAARKQVPEAFLVDYDHAVALARAGDEQALDADVLVGALGVLKKQVRDGNKLVKAAQAGEALPARPDQALVDVARAEVKALEDVVKVLERVAAAQGRVDVLTRQRDALPVDAPLVSKAELEAKAKRIQSARALNERMADQAVGSCFVCGGGVTVEGLLAARANMTAAEEGIRALLPQASAGRSRGDVEAELAGISRQREEDAAWLAQRGEPQDPVALTEKLNQARERLVALEADVRSYDAAVSARTRMQAVSAAIDGLKALVTTLERVVKELLFDSLASFEARACAALPAGYLLRVQLYDGSRQIAPRVLLGWTEQGAPVWRALPALSGTQKALVIAAVAQAWAAECEEPVKLLIVDDVWMDDQMIESLLATLVKVVGQSPNGLSQALVCACSYGGPPVPGAARVLLGAAPGDARGTP